MIVYLDQLKGTCLLLISFYFVHMYIYDIYRQMYINRQVYRKININIFNKTLNIIPSNIFNISDILAILRKGEGDVLRNFFLEGRGIGKGIVNFRKKGSGLLFDLPFFFSIFIVKMQSICNLIG